MGIIRRKAMTRPSKLIYKEVSGAGKQIHAVLDSEFNMVEFTKLAGEHMIATEPWIQFEPKEWGSMMDSLFTEMVDAWNEKYVTGVDHKEILSKLERAKQDLKADGNRAVYAVVDKAIQALRGK